MAASPVLRAYRELLGLIKRLPEAQRGSAWTEARHTMRQHAAEADGAKQQDLFKQLVAKISFLRVVTPRKAGEVSAVGAGHYVLREGKLVEGSGDSAGTRCERGGAVGGEESLCSHCGQPRPSACGHEPRNSRRPCTA